MAFLDAILHLELEADRCVLGILAQAEGEPGQGAGKEDGAETPAELTARANGLLRRLADAVEDARQAAEEADREDERERMLAEVARHEREARRLQGDLRKANLSFRVARERRAAAERAALLSGGSQRALRQRMRGSSAALLRTSEDVTMTLQRTQQMMGEGIERVVTATEVLHRDEERLRETVKEGEGIGGFVSHARRTITVLQRRESMDRVLNWCGLLLFALVVLYIVKKRLSVPLIGWFF